MYIFNVAVGLHPNDLLQFPPKNNQDDSQNVKNYILSDKKDIHKYGDATKLCFSHFKLWAHCATLVIFVVVVVVVPVIGMAPCKITFLR